MSERRGQDTLVEEVLTGGAPDPELLARYAEDPAGLDPAERSEIESQLASSPRARAALRALERFDPALFAAPAPETPARSAEPGPLARLREWLGSRLAAPVWIPAAAAAALLLALLIGRQGGVEAPAPAPQLARAPLEEPVADAPVAPAPASGGEASGAADAPPADEPGLPERPRAPESPATAPGPSTDPAPEAPAEPDPAPATAAPIYVAMLEPRYDTPFDLDPRERRTSYVRGAAGPGRLVALAPEHVARTADPAPLLLWWVERPQAGEWWLTVADPQAFEPLLRVRVPAPARAGVQRASLADRGVELEPGVDYQWSIAHRVDPDDPSLDVVAQAWIRRVPVPADAAAAPPHERAAALASAGLWYDSLAEIDARHRARPGAAAPVAALRRMLESAGLADLDPGAGW